MSVLEQTFLKALLLALGCRPDMRVWRQNTGKVRTHRDGRDTGIFIAGPPTGASDISGIVGPTDTDSIGGYRLEVEAKGHKTKDRAAQDAWAAMIARFGGVTARVRYNERLTMRENIEDAVLAIDRAIDVRRQKATSPTSK